MSIPPHDESNGYEEVSKRSTVTKSSHRRFNLSVNGATRTTGSSILDVGSGHGVPISQALTEEGFALYGVDGSAKMVKLKPEIFHRP